MVCLFLETVLKIHLWHSNLWASVTSLNIQSQHNTCSTWNQTQMSGWWFEVKSQVVFVCVLIRNCVQVSSINSVWQASQNVRHRRRARGAELACPVWHAWVDDLDAPLSLTHAHQMKTKESMPKSMFMHAMTNSFSLFFCMKIWW